MHILGFASSLGLFVLVLLATALLLGALVIGLERMEKVTVPVRRDGERPRPAQHRSEVASRFSTERFSSPGGCTFGPRL